MEGKVGVDLCGKYGVLFDKALLRASMAGEYSPAMHVCGFERQVWGLVRQSLAEG